MMPAYDHLFKCLIIGPAGTGKSNLLTRFTDEIFTEAYISTIGVDFKIREMELHEKKIKLQIWDTAGQERFRTITESYFKGAHGIFIVYDVTDKDSFLAIPDFIGQVEKYANTKVPIILIGNKSDQEMRVVSFEEGNAFATEKGIKFLETSAKMNLNIEEAFTMMIETMLEKIYKDVED